jgi:hypothetical protein
LAAHLISEWEATLAEVPMRRVKERVILDEAIRGLRANTKRSHHIARRRLPAFLSGVIRYGYSVLDWDLRRAGGFTYRMYCFAKD